MPINGGPIDRGDMPDFDYVLVGGGLQSAFLALALLQRDPGLRLAVVERAERLGGNHTWCFHAADVPSAAASWLEPLVVRRWTSHEVIFPGRRRVLRLPYAAISANRLEQVLRERLESSTGGVLCCGGEAIGLATNAVRLADGRALTARTVIDARGPESLPARGAGFQKFVGLELLLRRGRAPERPILMDARVDQSQGFRFIYVLPFAPDRLLVEDTVFSRDPALDRDGLRRGALQYLEDQSLDAGELMREETGVLPLPWAGQWPRAQGGPLLAGARGGWYHPATGYSIPLAVRLAMAVASVATVPAQGAALDRLRRVMRRQTRFVHFLNWMMFNLVRPAERWRVMERFYGLPEHLIARYYSLDLGWGDRARILLAGYPWRALRWPAASRGRGG